MTTPMHTDALPPARLGYRAQQLLGRIGSYLVLGVFALVFLLPLFWMLSTSLKPKSQWFAKDIHWIPQTPTLQNYTVLLTNAATPILRWFVNSLVVGVIVTVLILVIDSLAAYAYARMEFRGRKTLFTLLLATLFMPGIMFLVPNFLTIYHLGLLNSYGGVIIPGLAGVFGVFFLRQFFETIPRDLEEAAAIDGASQFQVFTRIALPLAKPALATLAIITFLGSWNDFLWPLLILKDRNLQTLPPGLAHCRVPTPQSTVR